MSSPVDRVGFTLRALLLVIVIDNGSEDRKILNKNNRPSKL